MKIEVRKDLYNRSMVVLYYRTCPNCKNKERNMVREVVLQKQMEYDDRYILALPQIWEEEARLIGAKTPFLYNPITGESLELDAEKEGMKKDIENFFTTYLGLESS